MSEQEHQPPIPPKRRRAPRTKAESRNHPAQQSGATLPASPPQPLSLSSSAEPPVGKKWGEFPSVERQAWLKMRREEWEREPDHGNRPTPFAYVDLTGADVCWLAVLLTGEGDADLGKKLLNHDFTPNIFNHDGTLSILHLEGANLTNAQLQGAYLFMAQLEEATLDGAHLEGAILHGANLKRASMSLAHLESAVLTSAHLEGAELREAHLEDAGLGNAHLEGADLSWAQLGGANLRGAYLIHRANLREATFDVKTNLAGAHLDATLQVADVVWNGVPLIRIDWRQIPRLGDEALARQAQTREGQRKDARQWLEGYETAARAYRQLDIALRGQGITEAADRFTYRALIMQRKALGWQIRDQAHLAHPQGASSSPNGPAQQIWRWLKGILTLVPLSGSYLFSLFLAILTGYGFRMSRIILAYGLLILAFGGTYWGLDRHARDPLNFGQALIVSITAFHGRVFSYNPFTLSDPQIVVTAIEAICGLVIEGLFVAMLVQRFFNR